MIIRGKGNFSGEKRLTFNILPADIGAASAALPAYVAHTGEALTPLPTLTYHGVTLVKDVDYVLQYADNTALGTATVTVSGIGNFTAQKTLSFEIIPRSIETFRFDTLPDRTYTGSPITVPTSDVRCTVTGGTSGEDFSFRLYGTDCTFSYENNINAGEATLIITGKGNFEGVQRLKVRILPEDINTAGFVAPADVPYTGEAVESLPTVTYKGVTLQKDVDYVLRYSNNVKLGTATVLVCGIGNFTGQKVLSFKVTAELSIDKTTLKVRYRGKAALHVTVDPEGACDLIWSSSNPSVVSVDQNGNLVGRAKGTAVITETSENGAYSVSSRVTVYYKWWQWIIIIVFFGWLWYI